MPDRPIHIGVLAMQGAFAEHVAAFEQIGVRASEVRTEAELRDVDAIVIPGGESTAIRKALDRGRLLEPLRARIAAGLPAFGTCAGLIVLADAPDDGAPPCFGLFDVDVVRNGFGRQVFSFEGTVELSGGGVSRAQLPGVFIRAPRITRIGPAVEVVGAIAGGVHAGEPVVVRQGWLLGATFHPELTGDRAVHEMFVDMVRDAARGVVSHEDS
ncbi:MAG: pyridoxal 5'-phosphate synthase glutaminase subunit PdxT [Thermoleophilia bacterium]|nr:pyridoxal 5'-phosphate synthase glutaminase subunit PdxT [Thermoleophilia bacterium]